MMLNTVTYVGNRYSADVKAVILRLALTIVFARGVAMSQNSIGITRRQRLVEIE